MEPSTILSFNDRLTVEAVKMLEENALARQKRFDEIKKNEDQYFGVNTPALKGRSNIPFDSVVMGGFIDTLQSGLRQDTSVVYGHTREQDKLSADKITAVWERESGPSKGDWNGKLADARLLASLSGVGITKLYVEGTPKFKSDLLVVDHYDFVAEATGGSDIDKHLCKFQMNIFRTKGELNDGVTFGWYDKTQVRKLKIQYQDVEMRKNVKDLYNNKQIRYATFGIDVSTMGYVGSSMYRLTEGVVNFEGAWWYLVFSAETKTWIRVEKLEDVFTHAKDYAGRGPWSVFHTHPHPFIFWTKAPADDVRPVAYTMKKIVNLTIDNLEKRNWDMTAYDPKIFTDPSQLLYRQDGLVRASLKPNQDISRGLFKFQTPDTTSITINLVEWLNNFLGQKTGITPDSQGAASTDRVGILVSNMQQTSKRLSLQSDNFKKSVISLAVMFDYGCYDHLREDYAIKIIGSKGAQWDEKVTRRDTERDFSVTVRDANEEETKSTIAAQKRELAFARLEKLPSLMAKVNPNEYLRTIFEDAGLSQEKMNMLLDTNYDGDGDSRAEAAQAIQDCLEGKDLYRMYRAATPAFVEKILDFCDANFDLIPAEELAKLSEGQKKQYASDMVKHDKLLAYAQQHIPIVQRNMTRKAVSFLAAKAAGPETPVIQPANPAAPVAPVIPGGGSPAPTVPAVPVAA